jgi:hypothetical protein
VCNFIHFEEDSLLVVEPKPTAHNSNIYSDKLTENREIIGKIWTGKKKK